MMSRPAFPDQAKVSLAGLQTPRPRAESHHGGNAVFPSLKESMWLMKIMKLGGTGRRNIQSGGVGTWYNIYITNHFKILLKKSKAMKRFWEDRPNFSARKLLNIPSLFHIPSPPPSLLKIKILTDVIYRHCLAFICNNIPYSLYICTYLNLYFPLLLQNFCKMGLHRTAWNSLCTYCSKPEIIVTFCNKTVMISWVAEESRVSLRLWASA